MKIKTDITFRVQRDDSSPQSKIKYYRLDTKKVEEIVFSVGYANHMNVVFDGQSLRCNGDSRGNHQCNNLPLGVDVPVVIFSVDFNPRSGRTRNYQWFRSKYSLNGSYYDVSCTGKNDFIKYI